MEVTFHCRDHIESACRGTKALNPQMRCRHGRQGYPPLQHAVAPGEAADVVPEPADVAARHAVQLRLRRYQQSVFMQKLTPRASTRAAGRGCARSDRSCTRRPRARTTSIGPPSTAAATSTAWSSTWRTATVHHVPGGGEGPRDLLVPQRRVRRPQQPFRLQGRSGAAGGVRGQVLERVSGRTFRRLVRHPDGQLSRSWTSSGCPRTCAGGCTASGG